MSHIPVPLRRVGAVGALSVSALLVGGLAACSTDDPAAGGGTGTSHSSGALSIQFVNPLPNYPAWRKIGDCMKDQAKKRGAEYTESGPIGQALDANAMISQIQQATANKKGAIVTFPASTAFAGVLKQAQSAKIVTGTFYGSTGAVSGADLNAGPDWTAMGEDMVNAVSKLPGKHVLGLVAAANTGVGKSWLDGMKTAAKKTANVTIAGEVYTGDDAGKALPQVNALLAAHPGITEIASHMGTTTPGAVSAIKSKGLKGKTFLLAQGHDNGGTEAMKDGEANLMFLQDVCTPAKGMVDGVLDVHKGKSAPSIKVPIKVVGKDEYQSLLSKGWS
ncbi:sugar ABC transporter substrate-binding protein [Streptomyces sp. NPDC002520]